MINRKNIDVKKRFEYESVEDHGQLSWWDFSSFDSIKDEEQKESDKHFKKIAKNSAYVCKKKDKDTGKICGSRNCDMNFLQTRGMDEGQTTFITCNDCGNVWRLGGG